MKKLIIILSIGHLIFIGCTFGAKFFLNPSSGGLIKDCINNIDIMIDTEGERINGAGLDIEFDSRNIKILGFYPNEIFNIPVEHKISNNRLKGGLLYYEEGKNNKNIGLSGIIKYGELAIRNFDDINETEIKFIIDDYTGGASDFIGIFELKSSRDILNKLTNGKYKFEEGDCKNKNTITKNNMLDDGYNYHKIIEKNINKIQKKNNKKKEKGFFGKYMYFIIIIILLIIILLIVELYIDKKNKKKSSKKKSSQKNKK